MRTRTGRALIGLMVVALPVGWASTAKAAPASRPMAAQGARSLFYTGNAFGTYAFVGTTVVAGRSSFITFGCTTTSGQHFSNTAASVSIPGVLATGAINTTGDTIATSTSVASTTSAEVHGLNLLGGVITADEVQSVSTTSNDSSGFTVDPTGTGFVNLVVGGTPITAAPPPNTTIPLPNVGSVVLNEQIQNIGATSASFTVNMIHVIVTVAQPGIAAGTEIVVAHATSDLELNKAGSLDGVAYGSWANLGSVVVSGRSAAVYMPCGGTFGHVLTNSVASVSVPSVLTSGTVTDTAKGRVTATTANGETTSTVQVLDIGGGAIHADLVKADAHAFKGSGGGIFLSDAGSAFLNLVVNGNSFGDNTPPNTMVSQPGLTIWLHRIVQTPNSIEIRMIEVIVTGPNAGGLQVGLDIRVAVAEASVH